MERLIDEHRRDDEDIDAAHLPTQIRVRDASMVYELPPRGLFSCHVVRSYCLRRKSAEGGLDSPFFRGRTSRTRNADASACLSIRDLSRQSVLELLGRGQRSAELF